MVDWQERLAALKQEALQRSRDEGWIDDDRAEQRTNRWTDEQIAAFEFAEMQLFDDMNSADPAIAGAALQGNPSAEALALAERDGYHLEFIRLHYRGLAHIFRMGMRT